MKSYRVNWDIDIDAKSPQDAARQALAIQRDPTSTATSFEVFNTTIVDDGIVDDHKTLVDLKNPKPKARLPRFTAMLKRWMKREPRYEVTVGFDMQGDACLYIQKGDHLRYMPSAYMEEIAAALADVLNGEDA